MGKKRTHVEAQNGFPKSFPVKEKKNGALKDKKKTSKKLEEGQNPTLTFTPQPEWHSVKLPELASIENPTIPPRYVLDELHKYADTLLEAEATSYVESHMSSTSSHKFLSTIMTSGTLEDKVSALTLIVQESPLHSMKAFEQLLGLSKKKSRDAALMALGALKDLLGQGVVLPPDRKLRAFAKQPGLISALQGKTANWKTGDKLPGTVEKIHLISWAYEDWLKRTYFEVLKVLEGWCNDEVQYARGRAVTMVWELLKEKPEQEENLLRLLINKLGDTDKKIASRASYLLLQLQVTHPLMKGVIINAIESDLLFRPGQSSHAKYYAVITLNQTVLSVREQEVSNKLLNIYFSLFVGLLKKPKEKEDLPEKTLNKHGLTQGGGGTPGKLARKKAKEQAGAAYKSEDEMKEKMIAQVLSGINRAFPFAKTDDESLKTHLETIFKVTHSANFNTSIQALMFIQQVSATKHYSSDRFYRTLYESLLDPRLLNSSKQIMYLNLLYRSLKADVNLKRVKAFVKRLLQIITLHDPPFVCGVLYLISELATIFPSIKTMISTPEDNPSDDEDEHYQDAPNESNPTIDSSIPKWKIYDGRKRDPEHAAADTSCLWELLPLQFHYHPSVHILASRVLNSEPLKEKPDPTLHTLINFLDKFVYKNPKMKSNTTHGSSIMQPLAGSSRAADVLITSRDGGRVAQPVNTEAFWKRKVDEVAVDEVFFHTYFAKAGKANLSKKEKTKKKKRDEDDSDEDGEEEIWKALVQSRPEIEGDEDDGQGFSDEDMEGMSEDDGDEDGVMDNGVELNLDSDEEEDPDATDVDVDAAAGLGDSDDDIGLDSADEGAFVGSDEEIPVDIDGKLKKDGLGADEDAGKTSKKEKGSRGKKRRKLKHLPTFASAEDYAKLLESEDSE
ncbi:CBF-domain-containing protein [Lepidopterella palustris CBS 459.81]|uniref:CBF-domain-containing protein n=1 Tax=Lepidopterella palustris CBS 459.81 TaxID=1314670 RepID=A0A8E2JBN5_9PEZI|nr:CBF-domain-containing protein [Lepidopterella palustris CBS 459.81]